MHNVWLIAKREYLERIRAKSFLIMTILIPLLMGGLFYGAALVNGNRNSASHIAIVTADPQFGHDLEAELARGKQIKITADVVSPAASDTRATLDRAIKNDKLDGYLWITAPNAVNTRPGFEWVPKSKADIMTKATIREAIGTVLTRESLAHSGMGAPDVDAMLKPVDLDIAAADKGNGSTAAFASAYALFFLMYFVIVSYGMNVARSILEEKSSRIFEVLLSTIRPGEILAGKVIGVGAVGLTQVTLWLIAGALLTTFGLLGRGFTFPLTALQLSFFILFFLLGYLLYSAIAAALGAMTSSEQELQQLNLFLMLPLIVCSVIIFRVVTDSDGIIAKVFSFIPFCTPLIMYVRIAVHQPPAWQIAIAVFDLVLTILAMLWFASRIYRVGILMYGKKPNLPEIVRWLKYT